MTNTKTTTERFEMALRARAAKAGCDITGLRWEGCSVDRTWGDRCGLVFYGASEEVCDRAARFYEAWLLKNGARGSYGAQSSIGYAGRMTYLAYSNGAKGWYRGDLPMPESTTLSHGFVLACVERRIGFATSDTYYPCAE